MLTYTPQDTAQESVKVNPAVIAQSKVGYKSDHGARRRGLTTLVILVLVWELTARTVFTNRLAFVPLSEVGSTLITMLGDGTLWKHAQVSLLEFGLGFGLAVVVGVVLGMLMGANRLLRDYLDPAFSVLYSTPLVALAPLFIMWFGIGIMSKVVAIFLYAVFPILINTTVGIATADKTWLEVGHAFCANRFQIFTKILFQAALPYIVAGVRMGVGRGIVAVVVAELFGASAGLGYVIMEAGQTFDTATLLAAVIVLAGSGLLLMELLKLLEKRLAPWRFPSQN